MGGSTKDKRNRYMGFNFSFFGKQEVRKFNYRPRFYDPEAEERREKYGDFTKEKKEDYVPGNHVKGSLRDGNYSRTKDMSRNQRGLGVVSILLLLTIIGLLVWFFSTYWEEEERKDKEMEKIERVKKERRYENEDPYKIVPLD